MRAVGHVRCNIADIGVVDIVGIGRQTPVGHIALLALHNRDLFHILWRYMPAPRLVYGRKDEERGKQTVGRDSKVERVPRLELKTSQIVRLELEAAWVAQLEISASQEVKVGHESFTALWASP